MKSEVKSRFRSSLSALAALVLVTSACGAAGGSDQGDGAGGTAPGGRLLTDSGTVVQSLQLSGNTAATEHFTFAVRAALPAADTRSGEFRLARTLAGEEFTVSSYSLADLDTVTSEFTWPETRDSSFFTDMAFSPAGTWAAAVKRHVGADELTVVWLTADQPELVPVPGFRGEIGPDLAWLDDDTLVFELDVREQTDEAAADYAGAIVSLDVSASVTAGEPVMNIMVGFTADEWSRLGTVGGFAVSPDGQRLVYSHGQAGDGDLWMRGTQRGSFGPVQLTSGSNPHVGAAFSPDGSSLAFVEYISERASNVFVIPADMNATVDLSDPGVRDRYLVTDGQRVRRILAWY